MKAHTSEFKNQIKTMGRELDSKITYTLNGVNVELGKEQLNSITPTYQGALLKSVMKELDIDSNVYIPEKTILNYQFGLKVNGKYEYINYGNYVVYKTEKQEDTNSYKLICYDKMLYTMIDYTPLDITYPINLREYINAIATKCGLEFANIVGTFANYDTPINKDNFSNGNYTFRDVLDYVAELVGGWFCINDGDKLEIIYPSQAKNYESDSGEEINFYTEVEDKIKELTIYGNSIQETRSGKNLIKDQHTEPITVSGVTFTPNPDGSIKVEGTSTANYTYRITPRETGKYISIDTNKTYTMSVSNDLPSKSRMRVEASNSTSIFKDIYSEGTNKRYITFEGSYFETGLVDVWFSIFSGYTYDFTLYPQLEEGSTATEYEPYGVSPSPDYPSEIESVGYENLFDINTATLNSALKWADGTYYTENLSVASDFIKIEKGKSYISKYKMQIILFNENKEYIGYYNNTTGQYNGFTISTDSECNYVKVSFRSGSNNNIDFTTIGDIQLEKGLETHSYIPYGKYGIEVKNTGKNLLNLPDGTYTHNGITAVISNGIITINGTSTATSFLTIPINLDLESNFSISLNNTAMGDSLSEVRLQISGSNFRSVSLSVANNKRENLSKYGTYTSFMIRISSGVTITNGIIKPQVELGYTTDYEPYQQNTSLFVLDQPLRSLPNGVKDELVIENGRAKIIKNVAKMIVANGYFYVGTTWNGYFVQPEGKINEANNRLLCDRAIANRTYTDGTMYDNEANVMFVGNNTDTIETLKAKYDGATLYYQLATPTEIDLGEVEIPSTFKGNNNITLSANISTNIDITYTKEYEEVDREFLKDVNVSFSKKYGPVNSVVFSRGGGSDNIYRKDYDSISANGLTEIKITDNPFLEDDERENFIQSVFDKLNGLEFYIMDVASTGITYLELGDLYYFNMSEDKPSLKAGLVQAGLRKAQGSSLGKYICLMLNDKIDITQGLSESIYADEPDITETDYKTASITDKSIKNAIIQTNKNSAEILLKVNSDEVVSAINLSPENIKISSAKLDIDAIATFTNSKLAEAGSTVINGANITTGSISCDRLNGGTINGQKISGSTISGGSISIQKGVYYFNMGTSTSNPNCSGLNVGTYGVKAHSDITATGFAITDSDTGKSQPVNIYDGHGHVHYLTFTGGILTKWEYK